MSAHTPGPWFSLYDDNGFYEIASEAVSLRIAFTYGEGDTDEANARLIAAAPESHECNIELSAIVRELCMAYGHPLPEASLKRSDAAIAKARGEA